MSDDLSEVKSLDWGAITEMAGEVRLPPPGNYICEVENAEWKMSSTGKAMLALRHRIKIGPDANQAFFDQLVVTPDNPQALQIFKNKIGLLGGEEAWDALKANKPELIVDMVEGTVVECVIDHQEYQGTMRTNVKNYRATNVEIPTQDTNSAPAPSTKTATKASSGGSKSGPPPAPTAIS